MASTPLMISNLGNTKSRLGTKSWATRLRSSPSRKTARAPTTSCSQEKNAKTHASLSRCAPHIVELWRVALFVQSTSRLVMEKEASRAGSRGILARLFSSDHKVVALYYGLTSLTLLFLAFCIVLVMRWQLAYPGEPVPGFASLFDSEHPFMPEGVMLPGFYNQLAAMHGTLMVFLAVVPLLVGGLGNYLVPLMIGAPNLAFPRLSRFGYWCYALGSIIILSTFFIDVGPPTAGYRRYFRTDLLALWTGLRLSVVPDPQHQHHCHRGPVARQRHAFHENAFLCLVAICHRFFVAPGLSSLGRGRGAPIDGPPGRHKFLHAQRPGHQRRAVERERGRQRLALAALVLVPGSSGGLRAGPAGLGHYRRNLRQQRPETAVRLPVHGDGGRVHGLHVVSGLGASYVPHRHGNRRQYLLSGNHAYHFHSLHHYCDLAGRIVVGWFHSIHGSHDIRAGFHADVRPGRIHGSASGAERDEHLPSRHLLRHRPLSLHCGPRHPLRHFRGRLPLVSQDHGPAHEHLAWPPALLAVFLVYERYIPDHAHPGTGRRQPPALRRRHYLRPRSGSCHPERRGDP
ncbi:MAG: cbb3-type cytochrome c oxidase subunit I [Candidatus Hydrogenedentes bacterium]|nr:cbb3-type cytochrome c oxidase subunit I [Candidatus Hydrogenedentota bacterium]